MVQTARPSADTAIENFEDQGGGTTTIYQTIDESAASDADYIRSPLTPANEAYATALQSVVLEDPLSSTGHVLRWRYQKTSAGGETIDITMQLRQGYVSEVSQGTLIAGETQSNVTGGSWTQSNMTLSGAEADAITDYTDLYARIVGNAP